MGTGRTKAVRDGAVMDTYKARDLMRLIAEGTYVCGDPGMQFDTTGERVASVLEHGAHQRVEPLLRVHVPGRLRRATCRRST
jgi:ribonucleotide reductase alpha subunit